MKTRGTSSLTAILTIGAVVACSSQPVAQVEGKPAVEQAQGRKCLDALYAPQERKGEDYAFDLAFPVNAGSDSFACDLGVRPSDARRTLDDFRFGLLYSSAPHLNRTIKFPLQAVVYQTDEFTDKGRPSEIRNAAEWIRFARANMTPLQIALVSCANLHNVAIVKSRSYTFFIASGMFHFQQTIDDSHPRLMRVSLHPVTEKDLADSCARPVRPPQ